MPGAIITAILGLLSLSSVASRNLVVIDLGEINSVQDLQNYRFVDVNKYEIEEQKCLDEYTECITAPNESNSEDIHSTLGFLITMDQKRHKEPQNPDQVLPYAIRGKKHVCKKRYDACNKKIKNKETNLQKNKTIMEDICPQQ